MIGDLPTTLFDGKKLYIYLLRFHISAVKDGVGMGSGEVGRFQHQRSVGLTQSSAILFTTSLGYPALPGMIQNRY